MRIRGLALLATALLAAACDVGPSEPDSALPDVQAFAYLDVALDIMQGYSVRRHEIDWPAFRETARAEATARGAVHPEDTWPVIAAAVERLGDGHSFFRGPDGVEVSGTAAGGGSESEARKSTASRSGQPASGSPSARTVAPGVGYLKVTEFNGAGAEGDALATRYHRLIESVEARGAACWVVDLRGNRGGNMWPMLAGVGPLLGEGTVGYFLDADQAVLPWRYGGGAASMGSMRLAGAESPIPPLAQGTAVAVLTDSLTASSGEAVAVAFRGRAGTRFFGEPTWGVSTANSAFALPDGAMLFLTVSTMVDRTGTVHGGALVPDEVAAGDAALDAALAWLDTRGCGRS